MRSFALVALTNVAVALPLELGDAVPCALTLVSIVHQFGLPW